MKLQENLQPNIDYVTRISKKARHLQLRFTSAGLELVIPILKQKYYSKEIIEQFISKKRAWIQQFYVAKNETMTLPQTIYLPSVNERWQINYLAARHKKLKLIHAPQQLSLLGLVENESACLKLLKQWLKSKAQLMLSNALLTLAKKHDFKVKHITIKYMKTRWGSCSSDGNINLSCQLIFLPAHLIQHVLLHELCHTHWMNHGPSFWKLLINLDQRAKQHHHELKKYIHQIPTWIHKI